jgi:hypothetical protein
MTILWEFDEKHPKQVSAYARLPGCRGRPPEGDLRFPFFATVVNRL